MGEAGGISLFQCSRGFSSAARLEKAACLPLAGPPQDPPHLSSPLSELCSFHLCSNTTFSVISQTTSLKMAETPLGFSHSLLHFTTFEVMLFVMFIILFLQEEYTCLRAGIFLFCVWLQPTKWCTVQRRQPNVC